MGRGVLGRPRHPGVFPGGSGAGGGGGHGPGRAGHDPVAGHRRADVGGAESMTSGPMTGGPVMAMPPIELGALDMAGTTVSDDGVVMQAFDRALEAVGGVAGAGAVGDPGEFVLRTMGQSKIEVFTTLFGGDGDKAATANAAFEAAY